jgi:hypothetical protein
LSPREKGKKRENMFWNIRRWRCGVLYDPLRRSAAHCSPSWSLSWRIKWRPDVFWKCASTTVEWTRLVNCFPSSHGLQVSARSSLILPTRISCTIESSLPPSWNHTAGLLLSRQRRYHSTGRADHRL